MCAGTAAVTPAEMSNGQADAKSAVISGGTKFQPRQKQRRRSQRSSKKNKHKTGDDNELAVLDAVADLRFADDFAEYMARAEGGGSAYGVLRRRAFAQTSLRIRRPAALEDSSTSVEGVSRQRRSRSLIPPPRRRSGDQGSADASLSNHKSLLQALCVQTQQQQKQQQRTKRTGTPQVNRLDEWACNASHYGLKFISVSIVHGVSLKRTPFSFFHNLLK